MFAKKIFNHLSRRGAIRIISFLFVILIALTIFSVTTYAKLKDYRNEMGYLTSRSLEDLTGSIRNIDLNLQKAIYCNSKYQTTMVAETLKTECENAKIMLSLLPIKDLKLESLNKFISQTGSYAISLSQKNEKDFKISNDERDTIMNLKERSEKIYSNLQSLLVEIQDDNLAVLANGTSIYSQIKSGYDSAVFDTLNETEDGVNDLPILLYDGPFSDHILNKKPRLTEKDSEITIKEAAELAAKYLGIDISKLTFKEEENSALSSYIFSIEHGGSITISKKGGYLVYTLSGRSVGEEDISIGDAISIAKRTVAGLGFGDTKESYYSIYDGVATVNLASCNDDFIFYTDLIKVSVSLDDGSIQMINARGFIMNHHEREIKAPKIDIEKAQAKIAKTLTVKTARKCVIPSSGENEIPCYEFTCKGKDEEDVLVYINMETGIEEQLLIVIHSEGGSLAM